MQAVPATWRSRDEVENVLGQMRLTPFALFEGVAARRHLPKKPKKPAKLSMQASV
jgi:hypothetical protein